MSTATSAFLNVLRVAAALIVFVNHCAQFWNSRVFSVTAPIAHNAVIVFFVLSGYVIAYSTLVKDRDLKRFVAARLSRLYSVVIPALLLTFALQTIGASINPQFYAGHSPGFDAVRYLLTGCFLQNVWHFSASPSTNAPFWSLSYEFWYYALFGVAVFVRAPLQKCFTLLAVSLVVGPNILLLIPCWLAGVGAFMFRDKSAALISRPRFAFVLSATFMLTAIVFLPPFPFDLTKKTLLFSGAFLSDWVTALAVGAAIVTVDASRLPSPPELAENYIRHCADHTFSLYLYHFPLIVFATAAIPFNRSAFWQVASLAVCIVFITLLLSFITEARRFQWRNMIDWAVDHFMKSRISNNGKCA